MAAGGVAQNFKMCRFVSSGFKKNSIFKERAAADEPASGGHAQCTWRAKPRA